MVSRSVHIKCWESSTHPRFPGDEGRRRHGAQFTVILVSDAENRWLNFLHFEHSPKTLEETIYQDITMLARPVGRYESQMPAVSKVGLCNAKPSGHHLYHRPIQNIFIFPTIFPRRPSHCKHHSPCHHHPIICRFQQFLERIFITFPSQSVDACAEHLS